MIGAADDSPPSRRIDKWLWCSRRFKTRSMAARFISEAGVRVTRSGSTQRVERPSYPLLEGDVVSYLFGDKLVVLTVTGFAERRGPPSSARLLCVENTGAEKYESPSAGPACKVAG